MSSNRSHRVKREKEEDYYSSSRGDGDYYDDYNSRRRQQDDYSRSSGKRYRQERDDGYNYYHHRGEYDRGYSRYNGKKEEPLYYDDDYDEFRRQVSKGRHDGKKRRRSSSYKQEDQQYDDGGGGGHDDDTSVPGEVVIIADGDIDANEDIIYIAELPDDCTKQQLVKFICQQYARERNIFPKIIGCSIRDYKNDCVVKFEDRYHARYAEEVLDGKVMAGFEIRIPRWEPKYINMFINEKFDSVPKRNDQQQQQQQQQQPTEPSEAPSLSPICYYFQKEIRVGACIYICSLPPKLGEEELSAFIVKKYQNSPQKISPEIKVCYIRGKSNKNDACEYY